MQEKVYKVERLKLMEQWEKECRNWIVDRDGKSVSATFFRDGIVDPSTWFNNDFRPLFILKEAHDMDPQDRWIDCVAMNEGNDYDIWNRRGRGMWRSLGVLAKGMIISVTGSGVFPSYEELYEEGIDTYRETLRQIAIINVKKMSGGSRGNSVLSQQTRHFSLHACKFRNLLEQQIRQINPTLIICCGAEVGACLDIQDDRLYDIPVVTGFHPATNPNRRRDAFYNETINKAMISSPILNFFCVHDFIILF